MTHLAMHNALNAIEPRYETYVLEAEATGADPVAAASQAAHDVALAAHPDAADLFAALHSRLVESAPECLQTEQGLALGAEVADGNDAAVANID